MSLRVTENRRCLRKLCIWQNSGRGKWRHLTQRRPETTSMFCRSRCYTDCFQVEREGWWHPFSRSHVFFMEPRLIGQTKCLILEATWRPVLNT